MTAIRVCRNPLTPNECNSDDSLLKWGSDISDPLLSTDAAAMERGRVEIDRQYTNRKEASVRLHQTDFIQPCTFIANRQVSIDKIGKVKGIEISIIKTENSIEARSTVSVEETI